MPSFISYTPLELAIALRESEAELVLVEQALLLPASEIGAVVDAATERVNECETAGVMN